jgi:hypothetical protein
MIWLTDSFILFSSFILARTSCRCHWCRSNSSTNRQPNHAPVKGAATGNAYIAFVAHDLRRWLLTCRGSATGVISSVPIHPFFHPSSLPERPTTRLKKARLPGMRTSRSPVAAGFMPACLGRRNIRRRIRGASRRRPFVSHSQDSAFVTVGGKKNRKCRGRIHIISMQDPETIGT